MLVLIGRELTATQRRWVAGIAAAGTVFWLGPDAYARKRAQWETGSWRDVQDWVRLNTPKDAIFVTPPQEAGFRVFSERTVVGEWKDGTQQYFDEKFATEWAARMEALGPADYVKMSDDQLTQIARRFGASFVVVPTRRRAIPAWKRNTRTATTPCIACRPWPRGPRPAAPRRNEPTRGDHGASRRPASSCPSSPPSPSS